MRTVVASSTKALGDELAASIDKFHTRCSAVEGGISSCAAELTSAAATLTASIAAEQEERRAALAKLEAAAEASAAELAKTTASKLDESAAEIGSACARMNAEIAQTAEDVLAIRTVMDAKIERECEALEASLQRVNRTFSEQLSSFQEDINGQVVVRLDDFDGQLAGVLARIAPCEDKLLEVALRAEVKSQTMLIDMRVTDVSQTPNALDTPAEMMPTCACHKMIKSPLRGLAGSVACLAAASYSKLAVVGPESNLLVARLLHCQVEDAVPQLQDSLAEVEEAWGGRLDRFEAELTDMSTDMTLLEAAVSSDR